jgi:hypothetical protein
MSDDLLAQMTRALADEHDGATAVPEATRARVVRTLAERRPRRRKWLAIGVPAFVLFGGSTAWAAATGNLPRAVERAIAVITGDAELEAPVDAAPASPQGRGKFAGVIPAEERKAPVEPSEENEAAEESETDPVAPILVPPEKPPSVIPPAGVEQEPEESLETHSLAIYRAAHEAHFKQGDCNAAVTGYKKYLREQPSGTFFLEATYNLGVCLFVWVARKKRVPPSSHSLTVSSETTGRSSPKNCLRRLAGTKPPAKLLELQAIRF